MGISVVNDKFNREMEIITKEPNETPYTATLNKQKRLFFLKNGEQEG
jgi:hypothetical protein